ncbi:hypothetical protein BUALT_Bualt06G0053100 [Buddleja alternifolia]|uniref:Uncharacterized protein n=1 Tax=Buddleja alternifolia TaxID=168488 RepID=A0AAV6XL99_9LAMI|nr:hypothetical protein BUALT_Bualt06G0053100 [Buddleja alternifolia]
MHATSSRVPRATNATEKQSITIRKARIGVKLSLNYVEFQYIPQYLRDMAWDEVEFNTTLPPEAKNVVLSALNEIWRKWKHKIKADYFLPHEDDEDYLSELPMDRIELDQWLDLVKYWQDKEKIAWKNANNVGKTECRHRTGRIPFAVLEQEIVGGKSKKQKTVQDYYVNSIKIGTRVHLFCHGIPKHIVGQGLVVSMDDDERKDDHAFVKVYVEKALIPSEKLRKPHEGARVIGEAVHKYIYWEFVDVCPKLDCILP